MLYIAAGTLVECLSKRGGCGPALSCTTGEVHFMSTNQGYDRSAQIYTMVVGALMVLLLAYGILSLAGVVR